MVFVLVCVCVCVLGAKVESAALHELLAMGDGTRGGVLLFPEICTMELKLLATGSPDLEVLSHVFHSLLGAVRANPCNAALLYDQVRPAAASSLYLLNRLGSLCLSGFSPQLVSEKYDLNSCSVPHREE